MSYEDIGMSHEDILSGQKHLTRWIVTLDSEGTRTRWFVRSHTFQHTATHCNTMQQDSVDCGDTQNDGAFGACSQDCLARSLLLLAPLS